MVKIGTREEYMKVLGDKKRIWRDGCPFCDLEAQKEYVIWKGKYWALLYSKYSDTGNDQHIVAVPCDHKKFFTELTELELLEFQEVHKQVKKFFGEKPYFSFTRDTDCDISKSVEHLHTHFIGAELQGKYLRKMLEDQGFPIKAEEL